MERKQARAPRLSSSWGRFTPSILSSFLFWMIVGSFFVTLQVSADHIQNPEIMKQEKRWGYISYVANDAYAIGGRVLGASLKATGTQHDLLMMVTSHVSQKNKELLASDGWIVIQIPLIANPFIKNRPLTEEEYFTFAKLHIWNSTALTHVAQTPYGPVRVQYSKLIYLDADISVLTNIDHLFRCGNGLCGQIGKPYPDMWNINVGVLVLIPSDEMLHDMLSVVHRVGSNYKLGEAGFINKYFLHWCIHGKLLNDPTVQIRNTYPDIGDFKPPYYVPGQVEDMRCLNLARIYNLRWSGDVGNTLIGNVLNAAPFVPEGEIIHYNGELKPWLWRLYPLHGWFRYWNQFATSEGLYWEHPHSHLFFPPLMALLVLLLLSHTPFFTKAVYTMAQRWGPKVVLRWVLRHIELVCIPYTLLACIVAPVVVYLYEGLLPPILPIGTGWLLFFEWSLFAFWVLFGPLCFYYYFAGYALVVSASNWQGGGQPQQAQQQQPQQQQPQHSQPHVASFWFMKEWIKSSLGFSAWLAGTYLAVFYLAAWWSPVSRACLLLLSPTVCCVVVIIWVSFLPLTCLIMGRAEATKYLAAVHKGE